LYFHFKQGGQANQKLDKNELLLHKATQSSDLKQLANAIVKYALKLFYIVKIAHMEGEEIFGYCK